MKDAQEALVPSHDLGPRLVTSQPSSNTTCLAVRVWSSTRAAMHWKVESGLVYMLADLVAASGGVPDEESGIGLVASFAQPAEAFRAAKRIQWSVLEYSQQQPENCLGAAIAVYHASDLVHGNHGEAAQGIVALLEQAKPSQIFLAAKAAKLLQDTPGLQLRRRVGPSLAASELEREAQELVWTTPQTQRRVQELLKQAARKVTLKTEPAVASEPTVDITREALRPTTAQIHATLFRVDHPSAMAPTPMDVLGGVQEKFEDSSASKSHLLWWLLPAVAVLVLVAGLYFFSQPPKKPDPSETPAAVRPTVSSTVPDTAPEKSAPTQRPVAAPSTPPPQVTTASKPFAPDRPSHPKVVAKVSEYQGFSEKDIPALIRMAESDAGAGNYANARREYEIILHLDPNNAAAKQGTRKLALSEQESP
jgi:hypothetical protein